MPLSVRCWNTLATMSWIVLLEIMARFMPSVVEYRGMSLPTNLAVSGLRSRSG